MVYDVLRGIRHTWKQKKILIAAEDLLFWLAAGIFLFTRCYRWNYGIIRWYFLTGVFLGMLLYTASISQLFLKFVSFLLKRLKMLFYWVNIILEKLFKAIIRILGIKNGEDVKTEKETDTDE